MTVQIRAVEQANDILKSECNGVKPGRPFATVTGNAHRKGELRKWTSSEAIGDEREDHDRR